MEGCTIWLLEALCIFSTLIIVNTSVNTSRHPNVKNTTQSSTYSLDLPSCKTVDGCTTQQFKDKCCSHTAEGQHEAWWQIDLDGPIVMEYVKIYYRDEGYEQRARFGGYQIYQSNTSDWRNGYLCYKDTTPTHAALSLTPRINCTGTAQYLTIYSDRRSGGILWYSTEAFLELCEIEVYGCPLGKFGNGNCNSDCDVGCANRLCDPETGRCLYCADGYFLSGFSCIKCPSNCYDNVCDVESGVCSACTAGYYGSHCNRTCMFTCKDNKCIQDSGECEDCEDGFFGSSCDSCSVGCTNVCDHISGNCTPCLKGFYGGNCDRSCPAGCKNDVCTQSEGICTACKRGYYGETCNTSCPSHCEWDICNQTSGLCTGTVICNQTSGLCTECKSGFYGDDCKQTCPTHCHNSVCERSSRNCSACLNGFYGSKCDQSCPAGCNNDVCTQSEGICTACKPGYYGDTCNKRCPSNCEGDICNHTSGICTVCEAGYYSSQCLTSCGKCQRLSCDMDSGECTSGCTDGWTGTKCDTKVLIKTKWDAAVGIGIGSGVVIVVLVIGIIVLVRRRKVKRSDTTVSSHMADISLSRSAKELNKGQDNTYDAIATQNKEHTSREISTNEANYEQLVSREVEIPHVYETTDDVKKT